MMRSRFITLEGTDGNRIMRDRFITLEGTEGIGIE